jgi:hypothetical protein
MNAATAIRHIGADIDRIHSLSVRIAWLDIEGRGDEAQTLQCRMDDLKATVRDDLTAILSPYGVTVGQIEGAEL